MNKFQAISTSNGFCCTHQFLSHLRDEGQWTGEAFAQAFPQTNPRRLRELKQRFRRGEIGCVCAEGCVKTGPLVLTDPSDTTVQLNPQVLDSFSLEAVLVRGRDERVAALLRSEKGRQQLSRDLVRGRWRYIPESRRAHLLRLLDLLQSPLHNNTAQAELTVELTKIEQAVSSRETPETQQQPELD